MSPPALDQIVRTCFAKDPESRWQTAGDVGRQLQWISTATSNGLLRVPAVGGEPEVLTTADPPHVRQLGAGVMHPDIGVMEERRQ